MTRRYRPWERICLAGENADHLANDAMHGPLHAEQTGPPCHILICTRPCPAPFDHAAMLFMLLQTVRCPEDHLFRLRGRTVAELQAAASKSKRPSLSNAVRAVRATCSSLSSAAALKSACSDSTGSGVQ